LHLSDVHETGNGIRGIPTITLRQSVGYYSPEIGCGTNMNENNYEILNLIPFALPPPSCPLLIFPRVRKDEIHGHKVRQYEKLESY